MSDHNCYTNQEYANSNGGYDRRCDVCGRLLSRTTTYSIQHEIDTPAGNVVLWTRPTITVCGPWEGWE